jgi:Protein of unknown function (DUF4031)
MFSLTIMRILVLARLAESVNIVRIVAEKQPNENGKTIRRYSMAVYVDPLFPTVPSKKWRYTRACHLTADTSEELHAFAVRQLGLHPAWYQHHSQNRARCHYDLTANKRVLALRCGAIAITEKQMVERVRQAEQNKTVQ